MQPLLLCLLPVIAILIGFSGAAAAQCIGSGSDNIEPTRTIVVDQNGRGNFKTIQGAIDSVPPGNNKWVKIVINAGTYREQVLITKDQQCIYLKGKGRMVTTITFDANHLTDKSATFSSFPNNVIVQGITFKNSYNRFWSLEDARQKVKPAVAARVYGDKSLFYECGFVGFQDTLFDVMNRHYYKSCYIEGSVDFIFGDGQSYFTDCVINATVGSNPYGLMMGYVTAQGRASAADPGGFVFKGGVVYGGGKLYLGRAYGPYSRVIFYGTTLSAAVTPEGWGAWSNQGKEGNIFYSEIGCGGKGSDKSKRVPWMKKLKEAQFQKMFGVSTFIDHDGWLAKHPHHIEPVRTIVVDQNGHGDFTTIQEAILSVPSRNNEWVKIEINAGTYKEQVEISYDRGCIFLKGKGREATTIEFNASDQTDTSSTFTSNPDNVVVQGITFKNSYNRFWSLSDPGKEWKPAVAARVLGDRSLFYECGFVGFQDTLFDAINRHYYKSCYIEGAVDFIFGMAQSYFDDCVINATVGSNPFGLMMGYVTAQGRSSEADPSGFVFRGGVLYGGGKLYLGRAYGPYSRVIFYGTNLSATVTPEGWDAWTYRGNEENFFYSEVGCGGNGSNKSKRVPWMKKLNNAQFEEIFGVSSFINKDGWLMENPLANTIRFP
ncbi:hypothetical protein SAY86_005964 [Trapa natans]|uniref:Pectinesterase n=1 Tax=Trapa natans TaxID=22666 RepID=A0AAN7L3R5_TRANT|nr:hypothetical protein SAY86_005964 [Trapa natans]